MQGDQDKNRATPMTRLMTLLPAAAMSVAVLASGCASTADPVGAYNPTAKFAQMRPVQPMKITGSRLRTMASPDDASPPTAQPVTVITRQSIEDSGAISVHQVLMKHVPNMVRQMP